MEYYIWKSGAGRYPSLTIDSIDDLRQTCAHAFDGEIQTERKDVTYLQTVDNRSSRFKLFSMSLYLCSRSARLQRITWLPVFLLLTHCIFPTLKDRS
jgi:hypothetical protein